MVDVRGEDGSARELPLSQLRLADFEGTRPWRRFRSVRGQVHYSGEYASATMGALVLYESRLELARLLLADFDPVVTAIYAQPCRLVAPLAERMRAHVPDFLLVTDASTGVVVNVKPAHRLKVPKIAEALAWPGELFEGHGWGYEVWSGVDPVVLANVRFLAGYRRVGVVPAVEVERAWASVQDGDPLAVAERRLAGGLPGWTARPAVMALLWQGRLTTDLSRPLSGDSVLRRHG